MAAFSFELGAVVRVSQPESPRPPSERSPSVKLGHVLGQIDAARAHREPGRQGPAEAEGLRLRPPLGVEVKAVQAVGHGVVGLVVGRLRIVVEGIVKDLVDLLQARHSRLVDHRISLALGSCYVLQR